jgi:radical SAM superfamily enzyme YgiQ (UPF0313 family)
MHGFWPPLGIIVLGTIAREMGHEVQLTDASFDKDLSRAKAKLEKFRPDIVGLSVLSNLLPNAYELARFAKQLGAFTMMGGPHATIEPRSSLADCAQLDMIVRGEGEVVFPKILEAISNGSGFEHLQGVGFRKNGEIILTAPGDYIWDLDAIPFADRDLPDTLPVYLQNGALNVFAVRGCPWRCSFCQPVLKTMYGKKIRYRSAANMGEELLMLHEKYNIRDFFFVDDVFTVRKQWVYEFRDELRRRGLINKIRFIVNSRVDLIDEEVAHLLKDLNCYYVLFGVESGSQEILDFLDKDITLDDTRRAFRACKQAGLRTHAYVMLGSPMETPETLRLTEEFIMEINPTTLQISITTPLKGTKMYDDCEQQGALNYERAAEQDYYTKDGTVALPIYNNKVTPEQVLAARARILKRRKLQVLRDGLTETLRDIVIERRLSKLLFRMRLYRHLKHYWG